MATNYNPKIVTSGLVVALDAINTKSYPGSGTTWSDMSGNSNTATLVNGPAFAANTIQLDGTNDTVTIPVPSATSYTTVTVEGFIKWNTSNSGMFLGFSNYDVWTNGGALGYNNGASNVIGISSATVTTLGLIGNFKHYAFVMNSSGLLSTNKIYINGEAQTMGVQAASDGAIPGLITTLTLGSWGSGGFYGNVYYGNVNIYNRELTTAEIKQNFNALRGRYSI